MGRAFPALIAGVVLCLLAYALSLRLSSRTGALWAASLVSTSSILIEYSTNARGYTLICCATVALLIAGLEALTCAAPSASCVWIDSNNRLLDNPHFSFSFWRHILWLAIEAATRRGKFRQVFWHRLTLSCGLASAGTFLVYLPAIAVNGPSALFRNQWVAPQNLQSWLSGNASQLRTTGELWTRDLPTGWTVILMSGFLFVIGSLSATSSLVGFFDYLDGVFIGSATLCSGRADLADVFANSVSRFC